MKFNYVLIDGDDTYECETLDEINDLIADISEHADGAVTIEVQMIPKGD